MMSHTTEGMNMRKDARTLVLASMVLILGCTREPVPYGIESQVKISSSRNLVWAVAPTVNLSGQPDVDPLLQSDIVFRQLQQVSGLTVIPVDRVVGVFSAVGIDQVQSPEQAAIVCDLLGADALLVPTVTAWEPYNPPKMGASLSLFARPGTFVRPTDVDPRELVRRASPPPGTALPQAGSEGFLQAAGMFDAADGSVREAALRFASGRTDPVGPWGSREVLVVSDKFSAFVYRTLTKALLDQVYDRVPGPLELAAATSGPGGTGGAGGTGNGGGNGGGGATNPTKSDTFLQGGPAGPQPFPANRR